MTFPYLLQTNLEGALGNLQEVGCGDNIEQHVELVLILVDLCFLIRQVASCGAVHDRCEWWNAIRRMATGNMGCNLEVSCALIELTSGNLTSLPSSMHMLTQSRMSLYGSMLVPLSTKTLGLDCSCFSQTSLKSMAALRETDFSRDFRGWSKAGRYQTGTNLSLPSVRWSRMLLYEKAHMSETPRDDGR